MKNKQKYIILSPDGFPTHHEDTYFESELEAKKQEFVDRFKQQGYYSTSNRERIPLNELKDYLMVRPVQDE